MIVEDRSTYYDSMCTSRSATNAPSVCPTDMTCVFISYGGENATSTNTGDSYAITVRECPPVHQEDPEPIVHNKSQWKKAHKKIRPRNNRKSGILSPPGGWFLFKE